MTLSKPIRFALVGFVVTALAALVFMVNRSNLDEDEDYPVALTSAPSLPLKGATLDTPYDIGKAVSVIETHDSRLTVRLVVDLGVSTAGYKKAVDALSPHANIMVEVLDSEELNGHSADWIRARTKQASKALDDKVDIWEIGNELNGEWTGSSPHEINTRAKAAYDIMKRHGGRAAITLNYWSGSDCYTHDWESTLSYARTLRSGFSKIDHVFLSVYETTYTPRQHLSAQDLPKTFKSLGEYFPNAYLGIGEVGAQRPEDDGIAKPDFAEKNRLANYYYGMHGQMKNSVSSRHAGGYFWWYFRQNVVSAPAAQSLWPSIREQLEEM